MGDAACQRWRDRRDAFRRGDLIDPRRHAVDVVGREVARGFVVRHHYSGTFPAARFSVGLYRGRCLAGVAVFSVPSQQASIPARSGQPAALGIELGRFVLLDEVEANGETWFLARAFRLLRRELPEIRAVLAYSDPLRRTAEDGRTVMPGHIGTIYQAFNARHVGRSKPRTLFLGPDGREVPPRSLSKLRNDERGAGYVYERLISLGAPRRRATEGSSAYVRRALAEGPFRRARHPGCFCYVWPLDRRATVSLPAPLPFPKEVAHG